MSDCGVRLMLGDRAAVTTLWSSIHSTQDNNLAAAAAASVAPVGVGDGNTFSTPSSGSSNQHAGHHIAAAAAAFSAQPTQIIKAFAGPGCENGIRVHSQPTNSTLTPKLTSFQRYIPPAANISSTAAGVSARDSSPSSSSTFVKRPQSSLLLRMTNQLVSTYQAVNPQYAYPRQANPRRVLTKPSVGSKNDGFDNENSDLILHVNDVLVNHQPLSGISRKYIIQDMLGQGTFGQVVSCWCEEFGKEVAVKVIKNQQAYYHQARVEIGLLQLLNTRCDVNDERHIVRMIDFFLFRKHLCLVFEKLDINLFELLKRNAFRGLSLNLVQMFLRQILDSLIVLRDAAIIHCDLKPENILLKSPSSGDIKLIDFGSACFENRTVYSYIQSRFYRSPEVVLGTQYTVAIDMWSFGCVAAELFLGLPLFPGASEHDLLTRIVETLGAPPASLLLEAKHGEKFFRKSYTQDDTGKVSTTYKLLTQAEFEAQNKTKAPAGKRYFAQTALADIISCYPSRGQLDDDGRERKLREAFIDFLLGVLDLDPRTRWTPRQALLHPFITGATFVGPFQPSPDPRLPSPYAPPDPIPMPQPHVQQQQAAAMAVAAVAQQQQQQATMQGGVPSSYQHPFSLGTPPKPLMLASSYASPAVSNAMLAHFSPAQQAQAQAQAHAIAMATLQQLSPNLGFLGSSLPSHQAVGGHGHATSGQQGTQPSAQQQQAIIHGFLGSLASSGMLSGAGGSSAAGAASSSSAAVAAAAQQLRLGTTPSTSLLAQHLAQAQAQVAQQGGTQQESSAASAAAAAAAAGIGLSIADLSSSLTTSGVNLGLGSSLPHSLSNPYLLGPFSPGDVQSFTLAAAAAAAARQAQAAAAAHQQHQQHARGTGSGGGNNSGSGSGSGGGAPSSRAAAEGQAPQQQQQKPSQQQGAHVLTTALQLAHAQQAAAAAQLTAAAAAAVAAGTAPAAAASATASAAVPAQVQLQRHSTASASTAASSVGVPGASSQGAGSCIAAPPGSSAAGSLPPSSYHSSYTQQAVLLGASLSSNHNVPSSVVLQSPAQQPLQQDTQNEFRHKAVASAAASPQQLPPPQTPQQQQQQMGSAMMGAASQMSGAASMDFAASGLTSGMGGMAAMEATGPTCGFPEGAAGAASGQRGGIGSRQEPGSGNMAVSARTTPNAESPSLNQSPGDWDPLYSDDQLLGDILQQQRGSAGSAGREHDTCMAQSAQQPPGSSLPPFQDAYGASGAVAIGGPVRGLSSGHTNGPLAHTRGGGFAALLGTGATAGSGMGGGVQDMSTSSMTNLVALANGHGSHGSTHGGGTGTGGGGTASSSYVLAGLSPTWDSSAGSGGGPADSSLLPGMPPLALSQQHQYPNSMPCMTDIANAIGTGLGTGAAASAHMPNASQQLPRRMLSHPVAYDDSGHPPGGQAPGMRLPGMPGSAVAAQKHHHPSPGGSQRWQQGHLLGQGDLDLGEREQQQQQQQGGAASAKRGNSSGGGGVNGGVSGGLGGGMAPLTHDQLASLVTALQQQQAQQQQQQHSALQVSSPYQQDHHTRPSSSGNHHVPMSRTGSGMQGTLSPQHRSGSGASGFHMDVDLMSPDLAMDMLAAAQVQQVSQQLAVQQYAHQQQQLQLQTLAQAHSHTQPQQLLLDPRLSQHLRSQLGMQMGQQQQQRQALQAVAAAAAAAAAAAVGSSSHGDLQGSSLGAGGAAPGGIDIPQGPQMRGGQGYLGLMGSIGGSVSDIAAAAAAAAAAVAASGSAHGHAQPSLQLPYPQAGPAVHGAAQLQLQQQYEAALLMQQQQRYDFVGSLPYSGVVPPSMSMVNYYYGNGQAPPPQQ